MVWKILHTWVPCPADIPFDHMVQCWEVTENFRYMQAKGLIYWNNAIFTLKMVYFSASCYMENLRFEGGKILPKELSRSQGSALLEARPWVLGNEYEWKFSSVSGEKGHQSVQENDLYLSHRNYQNKLPFLAMICALILWISRRNYLTLYLVSI